MPKKISVAIIGAGDMGQAIAHIVDPTITLVDLWDVTPGLVPNQKPLKQVVSRAKVVFFCVPSWALHAVTSSCIPSLSRKTLAVSITKGMEEKTGKSMDEFWPSVLPAGQNFALLLGPMLAKEMRENLGAIGMVAAARRSSFDLLRRILTPAIRLEYSRDVRGAAFASVMKNIYSISLGIADGLDWGGNKKGWLAAQAIREMAEVLKSIKAKKEILFSPAGVPDLLATGFSPFSRNRSAGHEMIVSGACARKSEGLVSVKPFIAMLGDAKANYPLLCLIESALVDCTQASALFESYFNKTALS